MASREPVRRLIVNADDFGRSPEINRAVLEAHEHGLLTTASLMVNEPAAAEAVALAHAHPRLGVGLHLTLVGGRSALSAREAPSLVQNESRFTDSPVRAGCRYFFRRDCRAELRREIEAQFARFQATGLTLDHVNGHLNIHLHPTVLSLLCGPAEGHSIGALRVTRDRFWLNARLAAGEWGYRVSHALIFNLLSAWARPRLRRRGVRHTRQVFGLLQNGRVDEAFLCRLLPALPAGDSELYCHPSLTEFRPELDALVSPAVRRIAEQQGLQLIRYQDL